MKVFIKVIKSSLGKIILKSTAILFFVILILMLNFKKVRALFPIPEIGNDKLIGFSQYYGYPFYFDTVFFFFLIFLPIGVFMVVYLLSKNK